MSYNLLWPWILFNIQQTQWFCFLQYFFICSSLYPSFFWEFPPLWNLKGDFCLYSGWKSDKCYSDWLVTVGNQLMFCLMWSVFSIKERTRLLFSVTSFFSYAKLNFSVHPHLTFSTLSTLWREAPNWGSHAHFIIP